MRLGAINEHDLALSEEMILGSPVLKPGDCLINDRGFLSREIINKLKSERGVDVYVPLRKDMDSYAEAVLLAGMEDTVWQKHPNKKRKTQKIAFIEDIGALWESKDPENDVKLNSCVVYDSKKGEYYVFVTTDLSKTARQIIMTYEIRPEIEEDYRQLKDFWKLEDFKSTKLTLIAFHIVCVLFGYLFFQLYVASAEGEKYSGKSLPVILKHWDFEQALVKKKPPPPLIIYTEDNFAILPILEFVHLYASLEPNIRLLLDAFLA
jgi:hypothetical protein